MPRPFFYGSYMDPDVLAKYGATPGAITAAHLDDWELGFTPHANIHEAPGRRVHGFLVEVSEDDLARLYGPSGFVTDYEPVAVTAETLDGPVPTSTFVAPWTPQSPDPNYLASFLAICGRLGLPAAYVESIA